MPMFDSTVRKNGQRAVQVLQPGQPLRSSPPTHDSSAEPVPYQPGSMIRACDQLNTHGMARRSPIVSPALRDGGRLPMLSSASSPIGVAARNHSTKPGVSCTSAR